MDSNQTGQLNTQNNAPILPLTHKAKSHILHPKKGGPYQLNSTKGSNYFSVKAKKSFEGECHGN
jgi:hypothetical protein